MLKINNKNTRTTSDFVLVFLLLPLNIFHTFSAVSIVDFEQASISWASTLFQRFPVFCTYCVRLTKSH